MIKRDRERDRGVEGTRERERMGPGGPGPGGPGGPGPGGWGPGGPGGPDGGPCGCFASW